MLVKLIDKKLTGRLLKLERNALSKAADILDEIGIVDKAASGLAGKCRDYASKERITGETDDDSDA
jgi:hypothetical protein